MNNATMTITSIDQLDARRATTITADTTVEIAGLYLDGNGVDSGSKWVLRGIYSGEVVRHLVIA